MGRYSQILLNFAYCLLVFCVADFRPLVIGGFFKLVVSLVLACLLAFVIVRLPNIGKLLASCLGPYLFVSSRPSWIGNGKSDRRRIS